MIARGPIETYLSELRRKLPYPAPRLVAETKEHLLEATSAAMSSGTSREEGERRAVEGYGPVADVIAAVLKEGSPLMSPRVVRWIWPLAVLLCLPTIVFMGANLIEVLAGNSGGYGVFGSTFDSWRSWTSVLVLGPMAAFALILLTSLRMHRERGAEGFAVTIELRMSKAAFRAAIAAAIVAAAVVTYGVMENLDMLRLVTQNWSCEVGADGLQVCVQGNR